MQKNIKELLVILIFVEGSLNAQNVYKKIREQNINAARLSISANFVQEYLKKCDNSDYTEFKNFNLAKREWSPL